MVDPAGPRSGGGFLVLDVGIPAIGCGPATGTNVRLKISGVFAQVMQLSRDLAELGSSPLCRKLAS
jgi:hypothetical protein